MKIARKPRPPGDIDVTSFSDIAFLLIIFFVLTTTFTRTVGLPVTIPSSTQDPARKAEGDYPTVVLAPSSMTFRNQEVTLDQLREQLAGLKLSQKKDEQRFIVLESSPDVAYAQYFQAVTAIAKAGGILAITEAPEEKTAEDGAAAAKPVTTNAAVKVMGRTGA